MPTINSRPPMVETTTTDYPTRLAMELVRHTQEYQDRCESDRQMKRPDDERRRTANFQELVRREAVVREVISITVLPVSGSAPPPVLWVKGELPPVGICQLSVRWYAYPGVYSSSLKRLVDSHWVEVGSREFGSLEQSVPKFSGRCVEEKLRACFHGWVYTAVPRRS